MEAKNEPMKYKVGWLDSVMRVEKEATDIELEYNQISAANVVSRSKIAKLANDKLNTVGDLGMQYKDFQVIVLPLSPRHGLEFPGTSNLISIDINREKVFNYLVEGTSIIGIYGMGGVGKTTLLKHINNKLLNLGGSRDGQDELLFDCIIWVVVSRDSSVLELQRAIVDHLKLKVEQNANKTSMSVAILQFLRNKRFILLLDDAWESSDLDKLGIPDNRKVIFTTRSEQVCGAMKAQKRLKVEILREDHSWQLFKENVGEEFMNSLPPPIQSLAKQVAKECGGLPLALVVLGRSMSSKKTPEAWQHLLSSLENFNSKDTNLEENLYGILKTSYDALKDDKIRQCFLFSSLYPEDHKIDEDDLIKHWLGHGLIDLKEYNNISQAYNSAHNIIEELLSVCLLEVDDHYYFAMKMHDVIRDMALWIACGCGKMKNKWTVSSGHEPDEIPRRREAWTNAERLLIQKDDIKSLAVKNVNCPNLLTLILSHSGNSSECIIPHITWNQFPMLSYLDLSNTDIRNLPNEIAALSDLQYLDLSYSEIELICQGLGKLRNLKFLFLYNTWKLKDIPAESISNLQTLQVLDLSWSRFLLREPVEVENRDGQEGIDEENLTMEHGASSSNPGISRQLDLRDVSRLMMKHNLLALGVTVRTMEDLKSVDMPVLWKLTIKYLKGASSLDLASILVGSNDLVELLLDNCCKLETLIMDGRCIPRLNRLKLFILPMLKTISLPSQSSIRRIDMTCCSLNDFNWILELPYLELLSLDSCKNMKKVVADEDHLIISSKFSLPSLKLLYLGSNGELESISDEPLDCPSLQRVFVNDCRRLKRLTIKRGGENVKNDKKIIVECERTWWEDLEWEHGRIDKAYFQPTFFNLPDFDHRVVNYPSN